ncbi:alpha/beta fold hydrolase [Nocardia sp. NPDC051750]|uniref:alpha/beta fold hydrolase n=1 Tax=Nocardia sp. NPDC051750 TaxID=3364325 RepID=UPI0037A3CEB6
MRGYVDTDWGQLHYRHSGPTAAAARDVVVLLHESPRSSIVYQPVLDRLGEKAAVYAFDTPGFGSSDSAPAGAVLADYARIFVQALDALGVESFVPVGMKTGSSLATAIAATVRGTGRVERMVLYGLSEPSTRDSEHWAQNWAPELEVTADGAIFGHLWRKNVGIYGIECPGQLAQCVAETVVNLDRYNSIYPAVFRGHQQTWDDNLALIADGVAVTVLEPTEAQMTPDVPIEFVHVPGTKVVKMPVNGQFAVRAPDAFVEAVLDAALAARA